MLLSSVPHDHEQDYYGGEQSQNQQKRLLRLFLEHPQ
jgi:hypothetical protein